MASSRSKISDTGVIQILWHCLNGHYIVKGDHMVCCFCYSKNWSLFFEDGNERTVRVNGEQYRQMLQTFRGALSRDDIWSQQDGATAHTARDILQLLRNFFPRRIISRFGDINWPTRSPDPTAPDLFLRLHLKARVFQTRPHAIQDLKNRTQSEVQEINENPGL